MAAAPNFPTYKWWETDDKTKRLYTELLAEKLSSPRKTLGTSLSRKPSNGKDVKGRLTSSPKHEVPVLPTNDYSKEKESVRNKQDEKGDAEDKHGKYTFETITIDTLAKYEYIKSPRKRAAATTVPVSFFEKTSTMPDNKDVRDKALPSQATSDPSTSNGHYLISQKMSSAKTEAPNWKLDKGAVKKAENKSVGIQKEKPSRSMKLKEIPEYTSSESSENSADETVIIGNKAADKGKKLQTPLLDLKEVSDKKKASKTDQPLKIEELGTKFQLLSEEVAQLEFKMFEFSDDIQKLKQAMGFKEADTEQQQENKSTAEKNKSGYGVTRQKSFTYADKFHSKAVLMKQQASPSKMLSAKPGKFLPGKLTLESTSTEEAMAELKKNEALNQIISKIKEEELSEDDIQEILRCAKDKYINKPNYLEELGYVRKND